MPIEELKENIPIAERIALELLLFATESYELDRNSFDAQSILADAGIDSFSLLELVMFVERSYGIKIPLELLTPENTKSIAAIANCAAGLNSLS